MAEISTSSQTQSEIIINQVLLDPIIRDPAREQFDFVDDELIESVWQELDGRVSHERIRQTAQDVAIRYGNAKVMTFLQIFILRKTLEQLRFSQ